jgi:hypothetical protein
MKSVSFMAGFFGTLRAVFLIGSLVISSATITFQATHQAAASQSNTEPVFQKGMSYTTYANMTPGVIGSAESVESLKRMKQIGVEWVGINVVGWYQSDKYSVDIHRNSSQAPSDGALASAIQTCHNLGIKVMLKPMIDLEDGVWRGEIQPSSNWFENYTSYIDFFAGFAEQHGVEMLCIGSELTATVTWESEWRNIISSVRQRYQGPLTYAAIWWKEYDESVQWWDALDYVGIDAYFPLSSENDPTINEMKATWDSVASLLQVFYEEVKKPIIFSEIGYLSTDGTSRDPSNYKLQNAPNRMIDLQEQADCYEATFQALWDTTWLYGFYWWYWQPDPDAGGPNNSDYTPQNKPAQGVLAHWYSLDWHPAIDHAIDYARLLIYGILVVVIFEATVIAYLWRRRNSISPREDTT